MNVKRGDAVFSLPGAPTRNLFTIHYSFRISFSTGFVKVKEDGTFENGASATDITQCHRDLTIPKYPRYGGQPDSNAFKAKVTLEGLGPLSDFLVGRRKHDDPLVVFEQNKWLGRSKKENVASVINPWRVKAAKCYNRAFSQLQEVEEYFYGEASYFKTKEDITGIPSDAEIIEVSSGEEEEERGEFYALSPTPTGKGKEKTSSGSPLVAQEDGFEMEIDSAFTGGPNCHQKAR